MGYEHTQHGKLQWLLWGAAVACALGAFFFWNNHERPDLAAQDAHTLRLSMWLCLACAGICVVLVFSFSSLTVRDGGDALLLRFGPWPFWKKRLPYADIADPKPARSMLIDGWGIHWFPGRGWTWNVWTLDCVEIRLRGKPFRIGTDDKEALAAFLQARIAEAA